MLVRQDEELILDFELGYYKIYFILNNIMKNLFMFELKITNKIQKQIWPVKQGPIIL